MSHPSVLNLLLHTDETNTQASSAGAQMERVFIEVLGEEGRSAVILTLGLVCSPVTRKYQTNVG